MFLILSLIFLTYAFTTLGFNNKQSDVSELNGILGHSFMAKKPVAILTDANFWQGA